MTSNHTLVLIFDTVAEAQAAVVFYTTSATCTPVYRHVATISTHAVLIAGFVNAKFPPSPGTQPDWEHAEHGAVSPEQKMQVVIFDR